MKKVRGLSLCLGSRLLPPVQNGSLSNLLALLVSVFPSVLPVPSLTPGVSFLSTSNEQVYKVFNISAGEFSKKTCDPKVRRAPQPSLNFAHNIYFDTVLLSWGVRVS